MCQKRDESCAKNTLDTRKRTIKKIFEGACPRAPLHSFAHWALAFALLELNFAAPIEITWLRLLLEDGFSQRLAPGGELCRSSIGKQV